MRTNGGVDKDDGEERGMSSGRHLDEMMIEKKGMGR